MERLPEIHRDEIKEGEEEMTDPITRRRKRQREYYHRPEVKAKKQKYQREYYQKNAEIFKERQREHYHRPEVKAKRREYQRKYYQKPEVKARRKERKEDAFLKARGWGKEMKQRKVSK